MPTFPREVCIVEVGPRDGLQNESRQVSTDAKLTFVRALAATGLRFIEASSFVHPKVVPQLADAEAVCTALVQDSSDRVYSALTPNDRGLERAIGCGIRRIAVFTGASETFTQKNIGMSIEESLAVFRGLAARALAARMSVRAYLSTCFVCPYEGRIDKKRVGDWASRLLDLGVDEVAISDTIGAAVPTDVFDTVGHLVSRIPLKKIALHFHDTYGTALANVLAGLELGISTFDSSAGGLGGCPFAPGASGNLATEDLVYMLDGMGIHTGVDFRAVAAAAGVMADVLGRTLPSATWRRMFASTTSVRRSCRQPE